MQDSNLFEGARDFADAGLFTEPVNAEEIRQETRSRDWADGARITYWVGLTLLGTFLVSWINALPLRFADASWQLSFISLLLSSGAMALLGFLLVCLARLFNPADRQITRRTLLLRTLASWIALGWVLLIPLQLFIGMRLINTQASNEIEAIRKLEAVAGAVRNASSEAELRAALRQMPNQPLLAPLTVPLEVGKANVLAEFRKSINAAKNRQQEGSSTRWQTWMREAFRNSLQSLLLALGFLAIGKNRVFDDSSKSKPQEGLGRRSRPASPSISR